jgi:phospholipid/cholesterol/gamma-HCH transport system permease protein
MAGALLRFRSYADLAAGSVARLRVIRNPMARLVFLRQIYFSAVRTMPLLSLVALSFGGAFITQATQLLRDDTRLYALIDVVLARTIAPLTAAAIIIGRSATVISTELALMRVNGEIDSLRRMRIPVRDYLVVPRVAAVTLGTVGCCFFFQLIAVLGGFAVSALALDIHLAEQVGRFAQEVSIGGLALEVAKSTCFGLAIAAAACGVGLRVAPRMEEVPRAPSRTFLRALISVIVIDALFLAMTF